MRKIIHVDMDAFYASVEQRDAPELRGRPVVVAWESGRSVVCAASYEARKFGIHSAMPAMRARRRCPEAVFVPPDFERYRAVSRHIREIFERHTPLVEPLSLDEAYLDVTEELNGIPTATEAARVIRREIQEETHLTASAGVAPNKFLAKIASDWRKPDGLFVIPPWKVEEFLTPLPVTKIPGVGKATERVMTELGIATVGDLRERSEEQLRLRFGKFGTRLFELARGIDDHPVVASREVKSISSENTFDRDLPIEELVPHVAKQARDVFQSAMKKERQGRTITVKLRSAGFITATRRKTPPEIPATPDQAAEIAVELLGKFEFPAGTLFRLVGVGLSNFGDEETSDEPGQSALQIPRPAEEEP